MKGNHAITHYEYDAVNRLTRVVRPDGTKRDYMYDAITRRGGSASRDAAGNLTAGDLHLYGPGWETLGDLDGVTKRPTRSFHLRQPPIAETKR